MTKGAKASQPFNDKKIVGFIAVLVLLGLLLVLMTNLASTVFSGARAFVDGEGVWSKNQKEASLYLVRYLREEEPKYYDRFNKAVEVTKGYSNARDELVQEEPDLDKVYEGFKKGRSNIEDIPDIIWIYENFGWSSYMQRADSLWRRGESLMNRLVQTGRQIHSEIQADTLTREEKQRYIEQIYNLDKKLTEIESNFSQTISRSTIYLDNLVYWLTLSIGFLLLLAGGFVTIRFIGNVKKWGASISESENKFRSVLEHTQDVLYQLDRRKGEYVYMSPSVEEMLGFDVDEVLQKGPEFIYSRIHPQDLKRLEKEVKEVHNKRSMDNYSDETEFRIKTSSGNYIWVSNKRSVILNSDGQATDIVGSVRNISERKEYEQKIDQSLSEKKILLQEIHHRVKNNLAVISGLLYLQKEEVEGDAQEALEKAQARIESVAMIHEKLYGSDSLSDINLAEYVDELTDAISRAYERDGQEITLQKDLEPVKIEIVDAVTFGLIINELVNNAYKHAFAKQKQGTIMIALKQQGASKTFTIADTGQGLPDDFNIENETSLGMTLIKSLSDQLGAEINIQSASKGTAIEITFT